MSILDLLVGTDVGPMDILESYQKGQKHKSSLETADLNRQAKQAELDDYLGGREDARTKRERSLRLQELNIEQKEKDLLDEDEDTGPMQDIFIKGKKVGIGQPKPDGTIANFKTLKQLTKGGGGKKKASRVGTPNKQQIKNAIKSVRTDDDLGDASWETGFYTREYDTIGNAIASRVRELKTQAKDLGETLNDADATSLAKQEFSAMEGDVWEESSPSIGGRTLLKDIQFGSGISKVLLDYLGVDEETPEEPTEGREPTDKYKVGDVIVGARNIQYVIETLTDDGYPAKVEPLSSPE